MTDYLGVLGTLQQSKGNGQLDGGPSGNYLQCLTKDYISILAGVGDTDRIYLGEFRSDVYLNRNLSQIKFDDMGTAITVDVGCDTTEMADWGGGSANALADNIDVAAAAGTASLLASVGATLQHTPLWKMLGLTADPRRKIKLYATFAGNPGTGNVSWEVYGS